MGVVMERDVELTAESRQILQHLALVHGKEFASRKVLSPIERTVRLGPDTPLREELLGAYPALRVILAQYAFGRRGREREELVPCALRALDSINLGEVIKERTGVALWEAFVEVAEGRSVKPNEPQNRGVFQGLLELAQEIYRLDGEGSIVGWVVNGVVRTGQLEPQFLRLVDIRGLGPKNTSTFLRDVSYIYELNDLTRPSHRIHALTVDKALRGLAPHIFPENGLHEAADWILAGKAQKYARRAGVLPALLTMGVTNFALQHHKIADQYDKLAEALKREALDPKPVEAHLA
jgi:hypothetical protein